MKKFNTARSWSTSPSYPWRFYGRLQKSDHKSCSQLVYYGGRLCRKAPCRRWQTCPDFSDRQNFEDATTEFRIRIQFRDHKNCQSVTTRMKMAKPLLTLCLSLFFVKTARSRTPRTPPRQVCRILCVWQKLKISAFCCLTTEAGTCGSSFCKRSFLLPTNMTEIFRSLLVSTRLAFKSMSKKSSQLGTQWSRTFWKLVKLERSNSRITASGRRGCQHVKLAINCERFFPSK